MGDLVRLELGSLRKAKARDRSIGAAVRSRRLELGLTRQTLAEAIGASVFQLQKFEAGTVRLTAEALVKIASALSVRPSVLVKSPANENRPRN